MIKLGSNSIGKIYLGSNSIGKAYLGSNIVFQKGSSPTPPTPPSRLPDGYTELTYVGTDSDAFINTGVSGSTSLEIITKFLVSTHVAYGAIYGNYVATGYKTNRVMLGSNSTNLTVSGGNNSSTTISGVTYNTIHELSVKSSEAYLDGTRTAISSSSDTANTKVITLGNRCHDDPVTRDIGLRIYSFTIKSGDTTILDYVPAKRDSDDAIGFYDLTNEEFVKSLTGTEFTAGPNA